MQLVIIIPDEVYNKLLNEQRFPRGYNLAYPIMHGTPIPKGHGPLVDIAELMDRIGLEDTEESREDNNGEIITMEDIDRTPIIIEADDMGRV